MSEMDDEKRDAINRLAHASAPLQWTSTGVLPQAVYLAESYIKFLEGEREVLLQAMFDARRELGFDTDGDQKFHIDAMNSAEVLRLAARHVEEAREVRKDYDDALSYGDDGDDRTIAATQINVLAQQFYEASAPRLTIAMTEKPKIVEGLTAVLKQLGYEVTP